MPTQEAHINYDYVTFGFERLHFATQGVCATGNVDICNEFIARMEDYVEEYCGEYKFCVEDIRPEVFIKPTTVDNPPVPNNASVPEPSLTTLILLAALVIVKKIRH